MNIWILWNIWQTLFGLRKPDIFETLWIFKYCEIFHKPCVAWGSPRAARMTTKIKENIFTGYPSHLRIMIIRMKMMMMIIIMITSGGDGHKIIKNDHLTLPLLFCFQVPQNKSYLSWSWFTVSATEAAWKLQARFNLLYDPLFAKLSTLPSTSQPMQCQTDNGYHMPFHCMKIIVEITPSLNGAYFRLWSGVKLPIE